MSVLRQWSKSEAAMLGRMSDVDVARTLRVAQHTVGRERKRRGIPKFSPVMMKRKHRPHNPQACICCLKNASDVGDYCRRCADELFVEFLDHGIPPQRDTQRG